MATAAKKKEDYYVVLNVEKTASQGQITTSYRKLALKYHPDRNRGPQQEEATEKFKLVSEAYAVVGDVTKRRQYDLHGADEGGGQSGLASMEAVEVENVGWLGRFLAAQVAKLGVPIPTSVSPEVLGRAKELAQQSKGSGGGASSAASVKALQPGVVFEGRLSLAKAEFFTLTVDAGMASSGLVLAARSRRKNDRFRVLVFDDRGDARYQAESSSAGESGSNGSGSKGGQDKVVARCRLFLTPYDTLTVGAPFPSMDDTPPVCHSLDTLEERGPSCLEQGQHLVCVYCDNFLSSIEFTLAAVPLESGEDEGASARVAAMQSCAEALRSKKQHLNCLAEDVVSKREALLKAQEEFKEVVAAAEVEGPLVADLLRRHAECQQESVAVSLAKLHYGPHAGGGPSGGGGPGGGVPSVPTKPPQTGSKDRGGEGGVGGFFRRIGRNSRDPAPTMPKNADASKAPPKVHESANHEQRGPAEGANEEAMPDAASL